MTALRKQTEDLAFDASVKPDTRSGSITPIDADAIADNANALPSPARALQQRLEEAALRSFYAPAITAEQAPSWGRRERLAIIIAAAISCWIAFAAVGYSVIA